MFNNIQMPEAGFMRLNQILAIIPVSKSTWWAKVKSGDYPQPVKLSECTTAWQVKDINNLIQQLTNNGGNNA